jgi:Family of unknown function (DUF6600)
MCRSRLISALASIRTADGTAIRAGARSGSHRGSIVIGALKIGRWIYTEDSGWYWASDEDFGWIVYHYGRWVFDPDLGWVWVPAKEWAPAWVQWRSGSQYVGWAPLPPDEIVVEYRDEPDVWVFVRARDFIAPRIATVVLPLRERTVFIRDTVVVNRTMVIRDRGPRIAVIGSRNWAN